MSGEAPDLREQEDCPSPEACDSKCDQHDNVVRPTVWQQNADMAATRDRDKQANVVLDVAVKAAIASLRGGRPGYALFQLTTAGMRAERILGPTDWATLAGGAR